MKKIEEDHDIKKNVLDLLEKFLSESIVFGINSDCKRKGIKIKSYGLIILLQQPANSDQDIAYF